MIAPKGTNQKIGASKRQVGVEASAGYEIDSG
jgi:hypothetical protein